MPMPLINLDLAALARSLRLPPYALRIVDLSALAPQVRERLVEVER